MNICRFENRINGQALVLTGLRERITACTKDQLPQAFAQIEAARARGNWIALLLDYELGEWLEPSLDRSDRATAAAPLPRLTALVFENMSTQAPWPEDASAQAQVMALAPAIARDAYIDRIKQIREWIIQGDVYQVNATFPMQVAVTGDAQHLYRTLANRHPVAYAAYIEDGDRTILSFSPELFLQKQDQTLTTKPMKGTAPRASDPQQDRLLGDNLLNSSKNRAENLMIVDLLRNDLGRVARPGTVVADPLFALEQYPSVWTMTSTVTAQLEPGVSFEAILRALFPCGSVTGAPKIAAMKRIQQTEHEPRGLYCGSIGWMAPNGDFSLNVAIRTLVLNQQGATYHVGGGIVYDSDPALEWEECHWKSRVLLSNTPELIETMLADSTGHIERLPAHLNRLLRSARQLNYTCPSPDLVHDTIQTHLRNAQQQYADDDVQVSSDCAYRVRLLLNRAGHVSVQVSSLARLDTLPLVAISPVRLDSRQAWLQHKTTYRPWYDSATRWLADHTAHFDLLFLNERDELCEGSRSNVYLAKDGMWITPPLRCGLLGGVMRQHLLSTGQVKEGLLMRQDLDTPGVRIRLSNGLRGWFDVHLHKPSDAPSQ